MFVDGVSTSSGIFWTVVMILGSIVCVLWFSKILQTANAGAYRKAIDDQGEENARKTAQIEQEFAVMDRTEKFMKQVSERERQNLFEHCYANHKPITRQWKRHENIPIEHEFEDGFSGQF